MTMCRLKIVGLGSACCVMWLWPTAAHAQVSAPREAAQLEFGRFSLYPSLVIADAGSDSNVFNDGQEPKQDYTFTVQSRALVVARLGLNELIFSTGSDYIWFRQYAEERSSSATYALRFNLSTSRFKPFVGAFRARTRSRPNPEIDARVRQLERQALAGANYYVTERTAITGSASFSDFSYDHSEVFQGVILSDALDKSGRLYDAGIRYTLTPLTTLILVAQYGEDIFPKSHVRDSKTYTFAPTLEFSPDAAIRGTVTAGLEVFKPTDPEFAEYKGATYQALVNWSLFGTSSFTLRGNRNVSYSYKDTEPYYLQTGANLGVTQRLFGPLELQASADRQYLSYRWHRGVVGTTGAQSDVTDIFSGGVGIAMKYGFRVSFAAERTKRRSSSDRLVNFGRTRLLSTVTVGS